MILHPDKAGGHSGDPLFVKTEKLTEKASQLSFNGVILWGQSAQALLLWERSAAETLTTANRTFSNDISGFRPDGTTIFLVFAR